jgi:hypothetical protein
LSQFINGSPPSENYEVNANAKELSGNKNEALKRFMKDYEQIPPTDNPRDTL